GRFGVGSDPCEQDRAILDEATVRRLLAAGALLDRAAACELLGCAPRTVCRLVASGRLAVAAIGPRARPYYSRAGIEQCLAAGRGPGRYRWQPAADRREQERRRRDREKVRRSASAGELI